MTAAGNGDALAQQGIGFGVTSTNPNVFVNNDLLNSLGPGGPAAVLPYYGGASPYAGGGYGAQLAGAPLGAVPGVAAGPQGNFVLTRPGTLLFPPAAYPRSHLVDRNAAVALNRPASAQTAAAPQLTPPAPTTSSATRQVAAEPSVSRTPPPVDVPETRSEPPAGLAPPPPVLAGAAGQQAAPPPPAAPEPEPADSVAETVPPPPAPSGLDSEVAEAPVDSELTPPPPPAAVTESTDTAAEPALAAAPPPPPTEAPAAPAAPTQEARVPPAEEDPVDGELRLIFTPGKADLSNEVKASLQGLAKELVSDGNARVQLLAYATSSDDSPSRARRLSLSRALAVRAFLIDQGVRSTRMDVRALGDKAESDPKDRVDIKPARR